jgi:predicted Fe-Mo cluster-binding NifX family protein
LAHKKECKLLMLVEENVDVVLATSIGEVSFQVLRDNIIRIYHLSSSVDIREAIRFLNQNFAKNNGDTN